MKKLIRLTIAFVRRVMAPKFSVFPLSSELLHQRATRLLGFRVEDQNLFLGWSRVKMLLLNA